ncbi:hypothetical protein B0H14DRAFT_3464706 [Mycena olivaceomarginata]|nr:hypothetical protein B0H14DRAFT_3464706 [Mycena olivaceomarginata]
MPIAPSGSVFSISVLLYSAESVVLLVPLAVQRRGFPDAVTVPAPKSPLLDVTPSPALPQSVLHSPKAPEYSSTSFTSNGVRRPAPPLAKPFHVQYQSSSPTLTSQRSIHEPGLGSPSQSRVLSPTSVAKQHRINGRPPRTTKTPSYAIAATTPIAVPRTLQIPRPRYFTAHLDQETTIVAQ